MHGDNHLDGGRDLFLSGLEWDLDGFDIPVTEFEHHFKPAERFQINYPPSVNGLSPPHSHPGFRL
ncbi:MAG TPA: hypothetical protein VMG63_20650 [Terriglobia bacterium]|nr:hypothetical protein [Terriglobia bacterium]